MSPPSRLWQTLNNSTLVRYLLLFACGWATVLLINYFYTTIALFTAAGLFAALLNYPVVWLKRYMPRGLAILVVFLGAVALLLWLITFVGLQILNQGQGLLGDIAQDLNQQPSLSNWLNQLDWQSALRTLQAGLLSGLGFVRGLFSSLFTLIFGAVISLYMLIDGEKLWRLCLKIIPAGSRDQFGTIFQQSFLGFLRGQLLLMLFLSTSTFVLFSLLGVQYSLILAVLVGLLDAIPGIGALLGVLVSTALVFVSQGGWLTVWVLAVSLFLEQVQENYVRPKIMGDELELNPVILFLALFIGQRVAGLLGIFLAIPIAGMVAAWISAQSADQPSPELASEEVVES
jgi:predicted PurR-regulated permease PerM